MSYTSIIAFDSAGHMIDDPLGEIQNSWRSAPAIWRYLEKTYLPPYFPSWVSEEERAEGIEKFVLRHGYEPSRCALVDADAFQEIIDLAYNVEVAARDRIVLSSTFDRVLVRKDEIPRVVEAFRAFPATTSLPEQADILEEALENPEVSDVGWIQTSVCCDMWFVGWDEEADEEIPYDLNTNDDHCWLFDLLAETR